MKVQFQKIRKKRRLLSVKLWGGKKSAQAITTERESNSSHFSIPPPPRFFKKSYQKMSQESKRNSLYLNGNTTSYCLQPAQNKAFHRMEEKRFDGTHLKAYHMEDFS